MADFVKVDDLAERTTLSKTSIYTRVAEGDIQAVWVGRRLLIPSAEADRFVEELRSRVH